MSDTTLIVIILSTLICILGIIQFVYYTTIYSRIYKQKEDIKNGKVRFSSELPPISVIVYAKEDADNTRKYLPSVLEQDYPQFEVIVINDGSTDESNDLLTILEDKYPHLYHSFTPDSSRYISRKKLALTLGIKASKYDWLVFTDANCYPSGKDWLRTMARNFTPGTEIVLGYSCYERINTMFNKLISFDNIFFSMRYLSFALMGKPYMGIGKNLAYKKELFFKMKGFSAHLNLRRGEDNLFINQIAHGKNTRVEFDEKAIIYSKNSNRAKDLREEKINYIVTSKYFRGNQTSILGFETTTRVLFYLTILASLIYGIAAHQWLLVVWAVIAWTGRFIVQMKTIDRTAEALNENRTYRFLLPLFDLLLPWQILKGKIYCRRHSRSEFLRK